MPIPSIQPLIDAFAAFSTGYQQFQQDSSSLDVLVAADADAQAKAAVTKAAVDEKNASITADAAALAPLVSAVATVATALAAELATPPVV